MDFFAEVAQVARAVHKVFQPDKVNYGAYGDTGHHLHFHIVPKYLHNILMFSKDSPEI